MPIKTTSTTILAVGKEPLDVKSAVGNGLLFTNINNFLTNCPESAIYDGMLVQDTTYSITWQIYYNETEFKAKLYDGKFNVKSVSLVNVASLSGAQTISGVSCVAEDIVLLAGQNTPHMNGVWIVKSGAWQRHLIFNVSTDGINFPGVTFVVTDGTYKNSQWKLTTVGTISMSDNPADFFTATWLDFESIDPSKNSIVSSVSSNSSISRFNKFNLIDATSGDISLISTANVFYNEEYSVIKTDQSNNYVIINDSSAKPLWILLEQNDFATYFVTSDYEYHFKSNRKNLLYQAAEISADGKLSIDPPAGYMLWAIFITASDTIYFDIGTTSGASDIISAQECGITEVTVEVKDEVSQVWLKETSESGWGGITADCKLLMVSLNPSLT